MPNNNNQGIAKASIIPKIKACQKYGTIVTLTKNGICEMTTKL